jgi:hypothetical protein
MIAVIELVGNVAALAPIGFLAPFVFRKMTRRKALALAVATGLTVEGMQVVFRVGVFDIDDVIPNGLGVMIGYRIFRILFGGVTEDTALQRPASKTWQWIMAIIVTGLLAVGAGWTLTRPTVVPPVNLPTNTLNWPAFGQAAVGVVDSSVSVPPGTWYGLANSSCKIRR